MITTVYKGVRLKNLSNPERGKQWGSLYVYNTDLDRTYQEGVVTYGYENTPLFAFQTKEDVARNYYYAEVIECEAELIDGIAIDFAININDVDKTARKEIILSFWKKVMSNPTYPNFAFDYCFDPCSIPLGTVFCKWIKPIREVFHD